MGNTAQSLIVFLLVFGGWMLTSFWMNRPTVEAKELENRKIPGVFKLIWGILVMSGDSVGAFLAGLSPKRRETLNKQLILADIKMPAEYVMTAEVVLSLIMWIFGTAFFLMVGDSPTLPLIAGLCCLLAGWILPGAKIASLADERQLAMVRALPFSIDLIGSAMRSGVDFVAAIRYYVDTEDARAPLREEYANLLKQLELGKSRTEAIAAMAARIQADCFNSFASAVIHGIEVGASIVETLRMQAGEMRAARFAVAEQKAAKAASAMILPIAVFIMPAMFLIIGMPVIMRVKASGLGGVM